MEEHCQNGAPMPTDMELMYEVAARALFPIATSEHQMEGIGRRIIAKEVDRAVRLEVQRQIAYATYILYEEVAAPLNEVGILMSELGSLNHLPIGRCLTILVVSARAMPTRETQIVFHDQHLMTAGRCRKCFAICVSATN
ncbi:hypothetical protein M9H77_26680 [Catharanthus roseus]|uniref:Uncharacterized protein n=1 Tax=Catharanthus roseus TaxID=4058 RepID=A0ACC0AD26_CATRO|nr:hypothetical protein M9H77_26680 [Catharanthus roseus]